MYTSHTKEDNKLILFAKFFILPVISIALIVFVINQLNTYSETDDLIERTESKAYHSNQRSNSMPKISSLSKGMDKK